MAEQMEYKDSNSNNECVNNISIFNTEFAEKYKEDNWLTLNEVVELTKSKEEKLQWLTEDSKKYLDDELKKIINLQLEDWIYVNDAKNIKKISILLAKYWFIDNSNEFSEKIISYRNESQSWWIRISQENNKIKFEKTRVLIDIHDVFDNNSRPLGKMWYWISSKEYYNSIKNNWLDLECK